MLDPDEQIVLLRLEKPAWRATACRALTRDRALLTLQGRGID